MLPLVDPDVRSSNPKFDALWNDLCNNKLNPDGTSKLDSKAQREHDSLSEVCFRCVLLPIYEMISGSIAHLSVLGMILRRACEKQTCLCTFFFRTTANATYRICERRGLKQRRETSSNLVCKICPIGLILYLKRFVEYDIPVAKSLCSYIAVARTCRSSCYTTGRPNT